MSGIYCTKYYCPYCGKEHTGKNAPDGDDIACCREVGHVVPVTFAKLGTARPGRVSDTEIACQDFDLGLEEAEAAVARIDMMASPSIISKSRADNGEWRFVVRSYSMD